MTTPFPTTTAEAAAVETTTHFGRGLWLRVRGGKYRAWCVKVNGKWVGKSVAVSKLTPAEAREMADAVRAEHEKNREQRRWVSAAEKLERDTGRLADMGISVDHRRPDGNANIASLILRNIGEWVAPEDKAELEAAARPAPATTEADRPLSAFVEPALAVVDRDTRPMLASIENHAQALLAMPVGSILPKHVAHLALGPLMAAGKGGAARNLRVALSAVFNHVAASDVIAMSPMADARKLDTLLPNKRKCREVKHRPAVAVEAAATVYGRIGVGARPNCNPDAADAARLQVLTAVRPCEAAGADAAEFDLERRTWTIPAERMKGRRAHTVPLSRQALAIVEKRRTDAGGPLFPELASRAHPTMPALRMLRRAAPGKTCHGWRSTFGEWAIAAGHSKDVVDWALAHVRGKVDRAYLRKAAPAGLAECLNAWADYLTSET